MDFLVRFDNPNQMIGKLKVHIGNIGFRHMAGYAIGRLTGQAGAERSLVIFSVGDETWQAKHFVS